MDRTKHLQSDMSKLLGVEFPSTTRLPKSSGKPVSRQAHLGQFMTPDSIARFMAGLFSAPMPSTVRLIDAGAGRAALTYAFVELWAPRIGQSLDIHTYEYDEAVKNDLQDILKRCETSPRVSTKIFMGDFIEHAAAFIRLQKGPRYTHAILNPPYKKINSASKHRHLLRAAGLETVNLYTGFLGLVMELLELNGELVAIIPRSFCNGPYYRPFRVFMLKRMAIRHIHLFESRSKAFKADEVLQENIIICLQRATTQGPVRVSTSFDQTFDNYTEKDYPFGNIVIEDDPEQFIHIPTQDSENRLDALGMFCVSLEELGINVSTGPVVDFRLQTWLCEMPQEGTVPLLYPGHFSPTGVEWPISNFRKPNAIRRTPDTEKWLYPTGFYAVVRRFSAKEERRRIVANVVDPVRLPGAVLGFENHLNVFHKGKQPLPELVARGISVFLNGSSAERSFRQFNGHTQVNATDLKRMKYPSMDALISMGRWARDNPNATQLHIDEQIKSHA